MSTLHVLGNRTYSQLFAAQIVALVGTGLLTVALGLLAFDIAGDRAGVVLGTALAIKMIAYVGISPIANALFAGLPRKTVLIGADLIRASIAAFLPFVDQAWQIYLLIFVLQAASATFTPTFQALIPLIFEKDSDYTKALSLSRLAYDLESLLSPVLAAALLTVMSFHLLFVGTFLGFLFSALLVSRTQLPQVNSFEKGSFKDKVLRGFTIFLHSHELRAILGTNVTVAMCTSMVLVNTVVIVQSVLSRPQADVALLLGAYGCGSMIVALTVPKLLENISDRRAIVAGAVLLPVTLAIVPVALAQSPNTQQWLMLMALWFVMGAGASLILTPTSRVLRRCSEPEQLSDVFAAQFSLSHACFLVAYPLAGVVGSEIGLRSMSWLLALLGLVGAAYAIQGFKRA